MIFLGDSRFLVGYKKEKKLQEKKTIRWIQSIEISQAWCVAAIDARNAEARSRLCASVGTHLQETVFENKQLAILELIFLSKTGFKLGFLLATSYFLTGLKEKKVLIDINSYQFGGTES